MRSATMHLRGCCGVQDGEPWVSTLHHTDVCVGRRFDVGSVSPPSHPLLWSICAVCCVGVARACTWSLFCCVCAAPHLPVCNVGASVTVGGFGIAPGWFLRTLCSSTCFRVAWEASPCTQSQCKTPPASAVRCGARIHPRQGSWIPRPYACTSWISALPLDPLLGCFGCHFPCRQLLRRLQSSLPQTVHALTPCCALALLSVDCNRIGAADFGSGLLGFFDTLPAMRSFILSCGA